MLHRRTGALPEDGVILRAYIPGIPKSKGSLKNVARRGQKAHLVEQVEGSEEWKKKMIDTFHRFVRAGDGRNPALTFPGYPYDEAVTVYALFTFEKPANCTLVYPSTKTYYDLDKLQRNVGDALEQGHVLSEDSRIVEWYPKKRFADPGGFIGVSLIVFDTRTVDA